MWRSPFVVSEQWCNAEMWQSQWMDEQQHMVCVFTVSDTTLTLNLCLRKNLTPRSMGKNPEQCACFYLLVFSRHLGEAWWGVILTDAVTHQNSCSTMAFFPPLVMQNNKNILTTSNWIMEQCVKTKHWLFWSSYSLQGSSHEIKLVPI